MPAIKVPQGKDPVTNLPPPGHERNEELLRRTDQLQEQAETKMPEAYSMPTDALEVDREIRHALETFSMHVVTDAQPDFQYAWVYTGNHGTEITMKKAFGWVVVQGNDKESSELQHIDSTRRLADCILMRIPKARYERIQLYEEYVRKLKMGSGDEEVKELGRKLGLVTSVDDPKVIQRFGGNTPYELTLTQNGGVLNQMMKKGTIPGLKPGADAK